MRLHAIAAVALATALLAGCGSDAERQDADEPEADFPVDVVSAKFPTEQRLAETSDLQLKLENAGDETVPAMAVTIWTGEEKAAAPFSTITDQPNVADPNRPVWILENGFPKLAVAEGEDLEKAPSAGAGVAQTDTFSFGEVAPGDTVSAVWRVTPVQAGTYTVHYEIAAGLAGNAKAVTSDGSPVEGEFVVTITDKPPRARVTGSGEVVVQD